MEALEGLVRNGVEVPLVVTQPNRPAGRRRRPTRPPVADAADRLGLPLRQPERIDDVVGELAALGPAVGVVCAYGQILPASVLDLCPWLNLHPSLLPRWRGAAPIERALFAGDEETGVAVMRTVAALDAGPLVDAVAFPIGPDDDAADVADAALRHGLPLLVAAIAAATDGTLVVTEQSDVGVRYAEKVSRADRLLDPEHCTVRAAHDRVRALRPHIGALLDLEDHVCTIWRTATASTVLAPGVVAVDGGELLVGFADGALRILELQRAGGRALAAAEWLRGVRTVPARAHRPA